MSKYYLGTLTTDTECNVHAFHQDTVRGMDDIDYVGFLDGDFKPEEGHTVDFTVPHEPIVIGSPRGEPVKDPVFYIAEHSHGDTMDPYLIMGNNRHRVNKADIKDMLGSSFNKGDQIDLYRTDVVNTSELGLKNDNTSVKEFQGFQLTGPETLQEINDWTNSLRERAGETAKNNIAETILQEACLEYDMQNLGDLFARMNVPNPDKVLLGQNEELSLHEITLEVCNKLIEESKKATPDPKYNYDFSVTLYPIADKVLGICNNTQSSYWDTLMDMHDVRDYGIKDKEDAINTPLDDWKQRVRDWRAAHPSGNTSKGMDVSLVSGREIVSEFNWMRVFNDDHLPTPAERAKAVTDHAYSAIMLQSMCADRGLNPRTLSTNDLVEMVNDIQNDIELRTRFYGAVLNELDYELSLDSVRNMEMSETTAPNMGR